MVIAPQDAKRHSPSRSRQAELTDRERWTDGREVLSARHLRLVWKMKPSQTSVADMATSTKHPKTACTWFGNVLPGPAWVLLNYVLHTISGLL